MSLFLRPRAEYSRQMKVFYSENPEYESFLSVLQSLVSVVTAVRLFAPGRSMTTPWSRPDWTTTPDPWSRVSTTCWPKPWRNTESRPATNFTDSWYFHHAGLETDTLAKVSIPRWRRRRQRELVSSGEISIPFYSPSGILHWLSGFRSSGGVKELKELQRTLVFNLSCLCVSRYFDI